MFILKSISNWFKWLSEEIEKVNAEPRNQRKPKEKSKKKSFTLELQKQRALTLKGVTPIPAGATTRANRLSGSGRR